MPTDHKRITGPETSIPYKVFASNKKSFADELNDLIKENGPRSDGRTDLEHRKMSIKSGVVSGAKGSAYMELGNTKVIVSCYDPREIPNKMEYSPKGELYCEFKFATFSCPQRRSFQQDAEEKQMSIILKQALEPCVCLHEFPNFQVDIYALVLENDGSAIGAAVTCAGVALAQASIPMFDLVTAATIGIINDRFIVDPTFKEEQLCNVAMQNDEKQLKQHGLIVMSVLNTHEQISQFYQSGNVQIETIGKCIEYLISTNKEIVPLVEKCLTKYVLSSCKSNSVEM